MTITRRLRDIEQPFDLAAETRLVRGPWLCNSEFGGSSRGMLWLHDSSEWQPVADIRHAG